MVSGSFNTEYVVEGILLLFLVAICILLGLLLAIMAFLGILGWMIEYDYDIGTNHRVRYELMRMKNWWNRHIR